MKFEKDAEEVLTKIEFIYHVKNSIISLVNLKECHIIDLNRYESFELNSYRERDKFLRKSLFRKLSDNKDSDYYVVQDNIFIINIVSILSLNDVEDELYEIDIIKIYEDFIKITDISVNKYGYNNYEKLVLFNIYWSDYFGEGDSTCEYIGLINSLNNENILEKESINNRNKEQKKLEKYRNF